MKVHLIAEQTVNKYAKEHATSISSFNRWIRRLENAEWENANDIRKTFPSADPLGKGSDRVVFDVGGNKHRIICEYNFGKTRVHLYVNWIGTHAEYTELCNQGRQYTVDEY
ncbi:type II toxin-antitoxin system HigB family toxin [Fodinibius sp.]|uniref:type II toxin-antitoxin system HigB family toxin n=1 Tax=Fodinibius sp. TaxID=1872440 RepID=UPI002ACEC34D|nr:type II toxin-antitoxin system HigB family toxin [Fodinibius sp.]MDZ7660390.1 type II toxin-antitoxin system HigB family toxin [Fodinibius sp.]